MTQYEALQIMKLGFNVFLTGAAGSGKTHVLNQYISYLKEYKIVTGITASTGIAATHMNGMTIHSWSGVGIRDSLSDADLDKMLASSALAKRIRETKVLIIDEVSMLHGGLLDMVDQIVRAQKDVDKPFGGIQVILCGDLFQLPPVTRSGETDWVFNADVWRDMSLKVCYLQEQHRQEDNLLLDVLNSMRRGQVEEHHFELLNERMIDVQDSNKIATKLYTHNADVESINNSQLAAIELEPKTYHMTSSGAARFVESLKSSCLAPDTLTLKVGAEVMFISNNQAERFVNGTRGKVVAFTDEDLPVIVTSDNRTIVPNYMSWQQTDGEKKRAEISQLPLRLAWAITVHKSQGMSLDSAEIDLSKAFEPGMGYVALSRVRTLDGIFIKGANNQALQVHPLIQQFDVILQKESAKIAKAFSLANKQEIADNQTKVRTIFAPVSKSDDEENFDEGLFDALREWRAKEAQKRSMPAYVVLADKSLKQIAARKPTKKQQLQDISGIGPKKLDQYGDVIVQIVSSLNSKKSASKK